MANKSNKTAICPYSVTKDIKDTSTDVPVAGQRIYIVNQGWCTGDGTTTLADLSIETVGANGEVDLSNYYNKTEVDSKISEIDEVGQIYYVDGVAKGEIFNVYGPIVDGIQQGPMNLARGAYSHAEGFLTNAKGDYSHTEGQSTIADGKSSHAEGFATNAKGDYSHAEGQSTIADGKSSHAEGSSCAYADNSHAEGTSWAGVKDNPSKGVNSHAEGSSVAEGSYSHSEGMGTTASGNASHAEGGSSPFGIGTQAIGDTSHAEGGSTIANGESSHSEGMETIASGDYQHVQGKFNKEDTENKYAHIVGNGYFDESNFERIRSNAHTLDWGGNAWFEGEVYVGGTNQDDGSKLATVHEVFDSANNALDERIISSDIISDNPYEEGLISEENYESLSEFNTFSSLSTIEIYNHLQDQITNTCVSLSLLEDTKTEINEALDNTLNVDNFGDVAYSRTEAENTFQSKDYIIYGYNIDGVYGIDDTYENIAEAYSSGENVYLIISEHEDIPYSVKLPLTKQSDLSGDLIFESACGITATMNSENVFTFDNTNPFIKQKVFDDTINTLIQRIETAETKTISGSIVTINDIEESTSLSVNLTSDTVTDFSNVTVYETGKNLFDINSWFEGGTGATKYLSLVRETENGIVINNSRTVDSTIYWYMFLPAGTYTFSLNKLRINSIYVSDTIDGEYTLKTQIKPADGELTKTITLSEPKYIKYTTYCAPGVETTLEYFQIELGEVATEFEPYKGTSFTPEASGKVSNMVSLSPTTIVYTNSIDTVVNVTYEVKESTIEIVDNLESTDDKKALSANQGRILNEKIDECKQSITKISKVSGAKMAIIGDSISYGVGSTILSDGTAVPTSGTNMLTYKNQAWWQLVRDRYGIDDNVLNNSQTGASFTIDGSSKDDEGNIINRRFTTYLNTDDLPEDLDIIMVFGGTNDWSQSKALGAVDDEPSSENNATFYAAVKAVLDYLTINFPDAQLVFVTPLQRYRDDTFNAKNTQNLYMKDYVDAIKTLCAAYGVQVVDLYSNSKFHMNSEEFRNTYVPDGTHPNAEGTERYVKNGIFPTLDQLWMDYKV